MNEQQIIEIENEEVDVTMNEIEKMGFMKKAVATVKKHGKKVLVGTGLVAVGLISYALGKNSTKTDFEFNTDDGDVNPIEESIVDDLESVMDTEE